MRGAEQVAHDLQKQRTPSHASIEQLDGDLATAKAARMLQEVTGSWQLLSCEDTMVNGDNAGTVVYPFGKEPAGLLSYDASGHKAIQNMKTPPPEVASNDWDKFTTEERVALYNGYMAYFGRYEVDAERGVVVHLPEADLSRTYIGAREVRNVQVDGGQLTITESWTQLNQAWSGVRVFKRLR